MKSCGRGFTLVELLVVIAIIAVLIALFLPAVHSARETGRQSTCQNNLKQLGNACQQHVSTHGWFPTGGWGQSWYGQPTRGYTLKQPGGWIYNVLPYMDQDNLRQMGMPAIPTNNIGAGTNALSAAPPLASLLCPTRRSASMLTVLRSDYAASMGTSPSFWPPGSDGARSYNSASSASGYPLDINYDYNPPGLNGGPDSTQIGDTLPLPNTQNGPNSPSSGGSPMSPPWRGSPCPLLVPYTAGPPSTSADPSVLWPPDPYPPMAPLAPGETPPPPPAYATAAKQGNMCWPDFATGGIPFNPATLANGVIYLRSQIMPAQVTDGLSNTVMLGEKSMASTSASASYNGTAGGDNYSAVVGHAPDNIRGVYTPFSDAAADGAYFGSGHRGGALLVFCDGSVHMISFSADVTTCRYLGDRNGHIAVNPSKLGL